MIPALAPAPPRSDRRLTTCAYLADALDGVLSAPRRLRSGADLIREGEATASVHLLIDGWACRYKAKRDGTRQIVALLLPGDIANLDTLAFDRLDYGVRALGPATFAAAPRARLEALSTERPGVAGALTRAAMVENAVLGQWALRLGRQSAAQRLAHLLCELSARLGGEAVAAFDLPMTQDQIADTLGLTPVHVNRTMQQLRGDGLIVTVGRGVTIPDMDRLRRMAEFDPAYLHREPARGGSDRASRPAAGEPRPPLREGVDAALLLQETQHRAVNDLQLVVSLLSLQERRARSVEARRALGDATERVGVLARARAAQRRGAATLPVALRQLCRALHAQAEPRGVRLSLKLDGEAEGLSADQVMTLALAANELATNAIKHAFPDGRAGHVEIAVAYAGDGALVLTVDDDGSPFPEPEPGREGGMGLGLVRRLLGSIDAAVVAPTRGSKRFEIRLPA